MNRRTARSFSPSAMARHPATPYLFLAAVSLLLYLKSAWFGLLFTWDDAGYVLDNPLVTRPLSLPVLHAIFTTEVMGNYAPLHVLTYALEHALWGAAPAGYHLVNVAVHAMNVCLVFAVIDALSGNRAAAFWAALLFAVHPVNVENVAWVSESKSLFAAFFGLLTLLLYVRYGRTGKRGTLVLAAAAFAAGLLFKVSIAPLPFVLVAFGLLQGKGAQSWRPAIPFFVLAAAASGLAVWAQSHRGAVEQGVLDPGFLFGTVYPTMVPVLGKYLGLLLVPVGLSGYYDTPIHHSFLDLPVLLTSVAAIAALLLIALKGSGPARFWTLWFIVFLLPAANIIPLPVYYADRYLYLPSIGFFMLLYLAAAWAATRFRVPLQVLGFSAALASVVLAPLAFARLHVWRDDLSLWTDTVRKSPGLYKPHLNLGIAYEAAGRLGEAEQELLASLAVQPTEKARYHLAMVRARREYERSGRSALP